MKKNIKKFIAIVVAVIVCGNVFAGFDKDGITYYTNEDGKSVSVYAPSRSIKEYAGDIVIPSSVTWDGKTYSVTAIYKAAFHSCRNLTSVTIPNSVTSIGESAFAHSSLQSITIPNSVKVIGNSAFYVCTSLKEINIPMSLTVIENKMFYGCQSLDSITIPNNIKVIGEFAFQSCIMLQTVKIGSGIDTIKRGAFNECTHLKEVKLGKNVSYLDEGAFELCISLDSITIPNNVKVIGELAFKDCRNLQIVKIGNGVDTIKGGAFYGCTGLKRIWCMATLPPELPPHEEYTTFQSNTSTILFVPCGRSTTYKRSAWNGKGFNIREDCSITGFEAEDFPDDPNTITINGMTYSIDGSTATITDGNGSGSVVIPSTITDDEGNRVTVTTIGAGAFKGNKDITSITIPATITDIDCEAFADCPNLDTIIMQGSNPPTICETSFDKTDVTVVVPCGAGDNYKNAPVWKDMNIVEDCDDSSIEDIAENINTILIYPNPARDFITINADGEVRISNSFGQVVKFFNVKGVKEINIADLESGVYYVKVGDVTKKLVIE